MMKTFKKINLFVLILAVLSMSCSNDDDNNPPIVVVPTLNIVETAQATADLSLLVEAVIKADLVTTLSGDGPFTVFAPTNTAFASLLAGLDGFNSLDDFDTPEEIELLAAILTYHVISGEIRAGDLTDGATPTTVQTETIEVDLDNGAQLIDATGTVTNITTTDIETTNGVVHLVDKVLVPQAVLDILTAPTLNIVETAQATADLSLLVEAVIKADLVTTLSSDGPFTVFAPTNAAFTSLLAGLDGFDSLDDFDTPEEIELLTAILTYHVISGEIRAGDLTDGATPTTVQTETIEVDLDNGAQLIDATGTATNITTTDIETTNGVVHLVDKVLLPEAVWDVLNPTIANFVASNADYSSLLAALQAASLVEALDSDDINYTVFAPNNAAFDTFLSANGFASLGDVPVDVLTQVLLNHVIEAEVFSGDLTTTYVSTLATEQSSGNNLSMFVNTDGGVTLNGISSVTTPDVDVRNGVIHAVDEVIGLPTVVTFATADSTFETLVAALTREPEFTFVETLSSTDGDPDPFTVFAPTNDAFGDLLNELSLASLNDIPTATLEATLNMHVVAGANVLSTGLSDDMNISTLGGNITANVTGGATLTDANDRVSDIIVVDVQAWNGVIHVINKVVLPAP